MMKRTILSKCYKAWTIGWVLLASIAFQNGAAAQGNDPIDVMQQVNDRWMGIYPVSNADWRRAVYHIGNIAQYKLGFPVSAVTANGTQDPPPDNNCCDPKNTIDNDLDTRWSAFGDSQDGEEISITFDLGRVRPVSHCRIAWFNGDQREVSFEIHTSKDNKEWTSVVPNSQSSGSSSGSTLEQEIVYFDEIDARYVKYIGKGDEDNNNNWHSITEFDVSRGKYHARSRGWAGSEGNNWTTFTFKDGKIGDDIASGQTYIELYKLDPANRDPSWISDIDNKVIDFTQSSLINDKCEVRDALGIRWIDEIFMALPNFSKLGDLTGNPDYWARMYRDPTDSYPKKRGFYGIQKDPDRFVDGTRVTRGLYNPDKNLWYRDETYKPDCATGDEYEYSGFWSRGNGWVIAGLAQMLETLPNDPSRADRKEYEKDFKDMAEKLKEKQHPDGYWQMDLEVSTNPVDPFKADDPYNCPETSGTAFFTYGLAWGINQGYLDAAVYRDTVNKAWKWLTGDKVLQNGDLHEVQTTGARPWPCICREGEPESSTDYCGKKVRFADTGNTVYQTEFAIGAFLLAGSEVAKLLHLVIDVVNPSNYKDKVAYYGLLKGEPPYFDRQYEFTAIPQELEGTTYIQTANADKSSTGDDFLRFTVNQAVTVYVAHDDRITSKPAWLSSFTDTGRQLVTTDQSLSLYQREDAAGTVTLGGNHGPNSTGGSMYVVVVVPRDGGTAILPLKPISPAPADGGLEIPVSTQLKWSNGGAATSYDVYFGLSDVLGSESFQGNQTSESFDPGVLEQGTTYYWRIDARNAYGVTTGDVWSFTTHELDLVIYDVNPSTYRVVPYGLEVGEPAYTDRDYEFTAIPPELVGKTYIQTANDDKSSTGDASFLSFKANQAVTVYVAHDDRITSKPAWLLNSFTDTGEQLVTDDTSLSLYRSNSVYEADTEVSLGGNREQGTGGSMYVVVVVPSDGDTQNPPLKAISPAPADGGLEIPVSTQLTWSNGGAATSYDIYFGLSDVLGSESFQGNQTSESFDPGVLEQGTTYYWRIDARNAYGVTTGDVWSFTTHELDLVIYDVNPSTYRVVPYGLEVGEPAYTDRDYEFTAIPPELVGKSYIQTANADKSSTGDDFLRFTVNQAVTVYVAHDDRIISKPDWLSSFTDTGEQLVTTDQSLSLYRSDYAAGTVTLGGNREDGTGGSMYVVVVVPRN